MMKEIVIIIISSDIYSCAYNYSQFIYQNLYGTPHTIEIIGASLSEPHPTKVMNFGMFLDVTESEQDQVNLLQVYQCQSLVQFLFIEVIVSIYSRNCYIKKLPNCVCLIECRFNGRTVTIFSNVLLNRKLISNSITTR